MTEPKKPQESNGTEKQNARAPQRQRPSRQEQEEYFRKAAALDLAVDNLFANRDKVDLAACLWR